MSEKKRLRIGVMGQKNPVLEFLLKQKEWWEGIEAEREIIYLKVRSVIPGKRQNFISECLTSTHAFQPSKERREHRENWTGMEGKVLFAHSRLHGSI